MSVESRKYKQTTQINVEVPVEMKKELEQLAKKMLFYNLPEFVRFLFRRELKGERK